MKCLLSLTCIFFSFISHGHTAEKVIWKGEVYSNGKPTEAITLYPHKKYKIKVHGFVNLGKWIQNKQELASDACYEFSPAGKTGKVESLQNSQNISVCDNTYHEDHIYESEPFVPKQNRIHFWVYDTNYDDNNGSFIVEMINLE